MTSHSLRSSLCFLLLLILGVAQAVYAQHDDGDHADSAESASEATEATSDCSSSLEGDYDLPFHIGAIFILMAVSSLGVLIPMLLTRVFKSKLDANGSIIQTLKLFGAGVIMATSLVHMLLPATEALATSCLPSVFSDYEGWAGALALFGILATHLIQIVVRQLLVKPDTDAQSGALTERQASLYVLEAGVATHSIIIGIILGFTRSTEFVALLIALSFHQFFEGVSLSSVVLEAQFKGIFALIFTLVLYGLSTPLGVGIGILLQQLAEARSTQTEILVTGVLEAIGAGILLYDVLVNIIAPHFSTPGASTHVHVPSEALVSQETQHEHADKDVEVAEKVVYQQPALAKFQLASGGEKFAQLTALYVGAAIMAVIGKWA